jgi:nucleoside-diphosphate-sugar epimerase
MLNKESPIAEWDGKQSRDFTYVANVVEANLRACVVPKISGEIFNIACGSTTSILDIIREANKILGLKLKAEYGPKRPGDVRKTYADISKMKNILGLKKIVGFKEGLKLTIDWFASSLRGPAAFLRKQEAGPKQS